MVLLLCFLFQFKDIQWIENKHSWGFFSPENEGDLGFSAYEGDAGLSKQHSLKEVGTQG